MSVDTRLPETSSPLSVSSDEFTDYTLPSTLADEEIQLAVSDKAASLEVLTAAVERCKELVLESDQLSTERKWLVRHLIELRLRLEEYKEISADPNHPRNKSGVSKRVIKGHHLQLQPFLKNANFRHCDHCLGTIWSVVQTWYQCDDCSYSCHYKCLEGIMRICAHVTATEKGEYEYEICPDEGLAAQKYLCAECRTLIPISSNWCEAKQCDYNGKYYCNACHWSNSSVIPARVIHNWDFTSYPVCQASLQLLRITITKPIINLEKLNPHLFELIHELKFVKRLRIQLQNMRKYLSACRSATKNHIMWKTVPYLIEFPDLYSLQDLIDIHSGDMLLKLQDIMGIFLKHITEECKICIGHGHICEICSNDQVLFPFDEEAHICEKCHAVFHKKCMERKNFECTKCARISARSFQESDDEEKDK